MNTTTLLQLAEQLPLQAQIELQDFAEFLVEKYRPEHPIKPTYLQMNWTENASQKIQENNNNDALNGS